MNSNEESQQQQPGITRRLLGAPPIGSAAAMRSAVSKNARKRSINTMDTEDSGEESNNAKTTDETEEKPTEEEQANPPEKKRKRRKKRRILLTDQGMKAKRKAERREKLLAERKNMEGDNAMEEDEQSESNELDPKEDAKLHQQPKPKIRPAPETLTPFQLFCDNILRKLLLKDPEGYFTKPVSIAEAPNYNDIIQTPMDFSTIRDKIEQDIYTNIGEFRADVELIASNAMLYNKPGSLLYLAAQKLEMIKKYYFGEKYLIYLIYSLPFGKLVPVERLGVNLRSQNDNKSRQTAKSKDREKMKQLIKDTMTPNEIIDAAPKSIKNRLTNRRPNCHLAYLDNRNGAIALNVLTPTQVGEESILKLGDYVKPLERGTPGICTAFEPIINQDFPITYTNPGPYASFAPQYDSTWATLTKRDSDLLFSCYGDKDNVADVFSLRQMVANAGEMASGLVEDMLNEITEGEHQRTIAKLEGREIREKSNELSTVDSSLQNTGKMIEELASVQYKRLSRPPPTTLSQALRSDPEENQLAGKIVQELSQNIVEMDARPHDVITPRAVHQALGLDESDFEILSEFLEV